MLTTDDRSMLSAADLGYIRSEFVPLAEVCAARGRDLAEVRALIAARRLPAPPYPGIDHVPVDYFDLPTAGDFDEAPEALDAYLDGTYFVCLRRATVANIVRKGELVDEVRGMLGAPHAEDDAWCERLRSAIDELDALERPFSPDYDRVRFGRPPTRDELIAEPRRTYLSSGR